MTESFPRQQAKTQGFTLGVPRSFQVAPDGSRVAFLRSKGGEDPLTCLWVADVGTGQEWLAADPATLGGGGDGLTEEERALRERKRERASGITSYATNRAVTLATFALAGEVYVARLTSGSDGGPPVHRTPSTAPAFDPRLDPGGRYIAYVCDGALRVSDLVTGEDRELAGPGGAPGVTFGLAEFIAAEEMGRMRGFWWAPDGSSLLVARVDDTPVTRWYIADPANPWHAPREVAYPAAGTANADVSLLTVGLDGAQRPVEWDRDEFPYLAAVEWGADVPLIVVQTRDQRRMRLLSADPAHGTTEVVREDTDPHWVDIVAGVPAHTGDGRIVWAADSGGAKRLLVASAASLADGSAEPVTPPGLQVRAVLDTDGDTVLFSASGDEPTEAGLWSWGPEGTVPVAAAPGVHMGRRAGGTTVVVSHCLAEPGPAITVLTEGPDGTSEACHIASLAAEPNLPAPAPDIFPAGPTGIRTALLLPSWHKPGSGKLPVLLDPYGGPHAQRVLASQNMFWTSQWFAEQGFAVVVADGRGTPGRGPAWERAVAGNLADPVLEDQVEALTAAARRCADLDLDRVAIRGWSFGGDLAALAALRRPEVFHAAVAGAPVTDSRLYDTHYTERYLGHPGDNPDAYSNCSVVTDAQALVGRPPGSYTHRPLMLIHGLADDNVVVAHTLRLSSVLLAAGYPHTVLPLTGVTHMASQEDVAENLLLLQVDFLRRALGLAGPVMHDTV
ncbi:MAG TPA: prolyl oligopeptidase family serine peptidase [Streptosporangiaceae bacterium]|nr:prolyl oligopeptidase family serine peptidase [Streptosporangiaceae bacterium]